MLFNKKQKPADEQTVPNEFPIDTFSQSSSFVGYKRIRLTNYGYQPAIDGIEKVISSHPSTISKDGTKLTNPKDSVIELRGLHYDGCPVPGIKVYIDGNLVGTAFDCEYATEILSHKVSKVHFWVKSLYTNVIGQGGKAEIQLRYHSEIFIQIKG